MKHKTSNQASSFAQDLNKERIRVLLRNSSNGTFASLYIAILFSMIFWSQVSQVHLSVWAIYMLMLTFYRYRVQRDPANARVTDENSAIILRKLFLGIVLSGIGWGIAGIVFYVPTSFEHQLVLLVCITGLCLGVVPINASVLSAAITFIALVLTPLTITTIYYSEGQLNLRLLTIAIIIVMLIRQNRSFYQETTESLTAQISNKSLLTEVRREKQITEELNTTLKAEMEEHRQTQKTNENLAKAIESSHDAIYITDTEGILTYVNNALCKMFGWSKESIIGLNCRLLESPNMPRDHLEDMHQILSEKKSWTGRVLNIRKFTVGNNQSSKKNALYSYEDYWCQTTIAPIVQDDGSVSSYVAVLRDISEDIKHENLLERDAAISELKSEVSNILSSDQPLINRMEDTFETVTDFSRLKLKKKGLLFLKNEDNDHFKLFLQKGKLSDEIIKPKGPIDKAFPICAKAIESKGAIYGDKCQDSICYEGPGFIADHGHFIIPMHHDGKILGIIILYTSLNPSHDECYLDLLDQLSDLTAMAIASDRIFKNLEHTGREAILAAKTKSEFLANMSHEIRTPMNGVLGMTELLLKTPLSKDQNHLASTIHRSGESLLNILNDILDFSKIEAGKMELHNTVFDLRELIEDVGSLFAKNAHSKNLELICAHEIDAHCVFYADKERITQILTNLVGNAIKFTSKGEVVLKSWIVEENNNEALLRFEVRDSGIGILKKAQQKIFDSFSQADGTTTRNYGGTGLGLSICKQLVELMQGEIGVTSKSGQGSTFGFTIKLEKRALAQLPDHTELDARHLIGKKVLVIDDHEVNRDLLKRQIESWGMVSCEVDGGPAALKLLQDNARESEDNFDLIISDYQMPVMDGREFAKTLQEDPSFSQIPIILLSSVSCINDIEELNTCGINQSLLKPVRQQALLHCIASSLSNNSRSKPAPEQPETLISFNNRHLLVAEDNPVNQELVKMMLTDLGYTITIVENGQLAFEKLQDPEEQFDMVLMDCQMPVMDGFTATKKIREGTINSDIKIIALTANAMDSDRDNCLAAGMDNYLAKPFNQEGLNEVIENTIEDSIETSLVN